MFDSLHSRQSMWYTTLPEAHHVIEVMWDKNRCKVKVQWAGNVYTFLNNSHVLRCLCTVEPYCYGLHHQYELIFLWV